MSCQKSIEQYNQLLSNTTASKAVRESFRERMLQEGSERYFEFLLNGAYGEIANTYFYFAAYKGGKTRTNWKAITFQQVAFAEGICEKTGKHLSPAGGNAVWDSLPVEVQERLNKALDDLIKEYPLPGLYAEEYAALHLIKSITISNTEKGGKIYQEPSSLSSLHRWCTLYRSSAGCHGGRYRGDIEWDRAFVEVLLRDGRVYRTGVFLDEGRPLQTLEEMEQRLIEFIRECHE